VAFHPGIVVVWSGDKPRYDTIAIPREGVVLGRERVDPGDIEISREHARLSIDARSFVITDLGGRNGTLVDGEHLVREAVELALPAVVRLGRTICVAVADIRPYEGVTPARRGKAVVGGTLADACRRLDAAALAEDHVALLGQLCLGRELAHSYADRVGGDRIDAELDVIVQRSLDRSIDLATGVAGPGRARSPRTMILTLYRPLTLPDQPELEQWLETDVRIVSVARCTDAFKYMPEQLVARLFPHVIELPQLRFDELPSTIVASVAERAPSAKIHASFIEAALLRSASMGEDRMLRALDRAVDAWLRDPARGDQLRNDDLDGYIEREAAMVNCVAGPLP
jgi:hypothetical protein